MTGQSLNRSMQSSRSESLTILPVFVVFASALLIVSFSVLMLSMVSGFRLGTQLVHSNPFAAYEAIWPGESVSSVAAFAQRTPQGAMKCISGASPIQSYSGLEVRVAAGAYDALRQKIACTHSPKDSVFRWMTIAIDHDQVSELELFSDVLQQESLLLYWGMPDSITRTASDQFLQLCWERSTYSATASIQEANSVVKIVMLKARE